ncbi:MAG TPA: hypothetical protein VFU31_19350 [Candidatus Binatia bacterium]|nr:hypothetical protein [Candidatus Binatia bacterium]
MKPATEKLFELRAKLQALAERGIAGEKIAAKAKLRRLEAAVDFSKPVMRTQDIFADIRVRFSADAHLLCRLDQSELELADFVKWALEEQLKIEASHRLNGELWARVTPNDADKLGRIALGISESFRCLWFKLSKQSGIYPSDRKLFYRGLYDGMMGSKRDGLLPTRIIPKIKGTRTNKRAVAARPGVSLHPYQIALPLGESIRFSYTLDEINQQLAEAIEPKQINQPIEP